MPKIESIFKIAEGEEGLKAPESVGNPVEGRSAHETDLDSESICQQALVELPRLERLCGRLRAMNDRDKPSQVELEEALSQIQGMHGTSDPDRVRLLSRFAELPRLVIDCDRYDLEWLHDGAYAAFHKIREEVFASLVASVSPIATDGLCNLVRGNQYWNSESAFQALVSEPAYECLAVELAWEAIFNAEEKGERSIGLYNGTATQYLISKFEKPEIQSGLIDFLGRLTNLRIRHSVESPHKGFWGSKFLGSEIELLKFFGTQIENPVIRSKLADWLNAGIVTNATYEIESSGLFKAIAPYLINDSNLVPNYHKLLLSAWRISDLDKDILGVIDKTNWQENRSTLLTELESWLDRIGTGTNLTLEKILAVSEVLVRALGRDLSGSGDERLLTICASLAEGRWKGEELRGAQQLASEAAKVLSKERDLMAKELFAAKDLAALWLGEGDVVPKGDIMTPNSAYGPALNTAQIDKVKEELKETAVRNQGESESDWSTRVRGRLGKFVTDNLPLVKSYARIGMNCDFALELLEDGSNSLSSKLNKLGALSNELEVTERSWRWRAVKFFGRSIGKEILSESLSEQDELCHAVMKDAVVLANLLKDIKRSSGDQVRLDTYQERNFTQAVYAVCTEAAEIKLRERLGQNPSSEERQSFINSILMLREPLKGMNGIVRGVLRDMMEITDVKVQVALHDLREECKDVLEECCKGPERETARISESVAAATEVREVELEREKSPQLIKPLQQSTETKVVASSSQSKADSKDNLKPHREKRRVAAAPIMVEED